MSDLGDDDDTDLEDCNAPEIEDAGDPQLGALIEVAFRREVGDPPVQVRSAPTVRCRHQHLIADAEHRSIECKLCGATVDVFDAVMILGERLEDRRSWLERARRECEEQTRKTKDLRKEEKRVRGRLATLRKNVAIVPTEAAELDTLRAFWSAYCRRDHREVEQIKQLLARRANQAAATTTRV